VSQATTWRLGASVEPVGRASSCLQVICGTVNCTAAGSTATSEGVRVRNFSRALYVAASAAWEAGAASCAAMGSAVRRFFRTSFWISFSGLFVGVGVAPGALVAVAVGVLDGAADGVADGFGLPEAPGVGLAGGTATSAVVWLSTLRKRSFAV